MYLDMMQQVMSHVSKVMVDQKKGNSLLYLPLDKLLEKTRAGSADTDVQVSTKSDTAQGSDNAATQSARDSLLSRNRETR